MRGLRVRFACASPLLPEQAAILEGVPGVCVTKPPYFPRDGEFPPDPDPGPFLSGMSVDAPIDAFPAVTRYLDVWSKGPRTQVYRRSGTSPDAVPVTVDDLPSVRPEVKSRLYTYQREGYDFLHARGGGLAHWECVAGDAEIVVNRAGGARRMTLADLERKFNGRKGHWDSSIPTRTRCMDDRGSLVLGDVAAVLYRGVRPVLELTLASGERLRATPDHVFPTPKGDRSLGELLVGDGVFVAGRTAAVPRGKQKDGTRKKYGVVTAMHNHPHASHWLRNRTNEGRPGPSRSATVLLKGIPTRIVGVVPAGTTAVYDVVMAGPWHNFVANGIVVHNCGGGKTFLGLLFADADPGRPPRRRVNGEVPAWGPRRIVIVTLPTTCYQWASVVADSTFPGSMPWIVLENESPLIVKPSPAPPPCVRLRVPRDEARRTWLTGCPRAVVTFQVGPRTEAAPKKEIPEEGTEVPRAKAGAIRPYAVLWPLLPDTVEDFLDALETGGPSPDFPADLLRTAKKLGLLEETASERGARFDVIRRKGGTVRSFDGREPLFLPEKDLSAVLAGLQGMETSDVDRRRFSVLSLSANGESVAHVIERTGLDEDTVLDVRAKASAARWVESLRSSCDLAPEIQVCILSWQLLPARREFLRDWQPTTIILDESHSAKAHDIWTVESSFGKDQFLYNRSVAASAHYLAESVPTPRMLLLTANPAPNLIPDWWSQLQILTRGYGKFRAFADRYAEGQMTQINERLTVYRAEGASNVREFDERAGWWVHRVTKADLDRVLPPFRREVTHIPPEELAKVVIPASEWKAAKERGAQGMQEMHVLHAAACKRPFVARRALEHLDAGLKVVIFSGRILDCDLTYQEIVAALEKRGKKIDTWCIHGESLPADHGRFIRDFAYGTWLPHPGPCLLIGTEDVWGTGVDGLQTTHRVLRARLPVTPLQLEQPEGRFDRPIPPELPQVSTVIEYFHGVGTIDDRILELFENKMHVVGQTYGAFRQKMKDAVASFQGHENAEEAMQALAERLTSGLPDSMFDSFDEDE